MRRIIIIHYHLNPGGVTRIIESQTQALRDYDPATEILILTASCENPDPVVQTGAKLILEQKLNYLPEGIDYNSEYNSLHKFFESILRKGDILHVHNLNLGKNPVLTLVISELMKNGYPVVNHAHDFAEERPVNYRFMSQVINELSTLKLSHILYPDKRNFLHIVLNSSDRTKLLEFGVKQDKIFVVPNPVVLSNQNNLPPSAEIRVSIIEKLQLDAAKKIITYPVRVIQRKNIGEYILLCHLFQEKANWLVTQPPRNPVEIRPYMKWKEFCIGHKIPIHFEVGNRVDFEALIGISDYCFTTSIREGFGMAYMEPWLFGTPVIGRNLANITSDLRNAGINFPLLYDSIDIDWKSKKTDFASLPAADQMEYISGLVNDPLRSKELVSHNRFLEKLLISVDQRLIDNNKAIILQEFSLLKYAQRLERIYQKITQ